VHSDDASHELEIHARDISPDHAATMPLFDEQAYLNALAYAMDRIDGKYGHHTIYFGAMFGAQDLHPRISA